MPKKPDFKDKSWDTTVWSLWGLLYNGAASDRALQTAISQRFGETRSLLEQLGPQVDPLKAKVEEWRDELTSYARTIRYGEADTILKRLNELHGEIGQQLERDRLLPKTLAKPVKVAPNLRMSSSSDSDDPDADPDEDMAFALHYQNTVMGHGVATAKNPPKKVKTKYVPPSPEQIWEWEQRDMASRSDNGIKFGAHDVNQASVLNRLNLNPGETVKQHRVGPENSHERVMVTSANRQFWTLGLTHQQRRDEGNFCVYRRIGSSSTYEHVSGVRHLKDPDA